MFRGAGQGGQVVGEPAPERGGQRGRGGDGHEPHHGQQEVLDQYPVAVGQGVAGQRRPERDDEREEPQYGQAGGRGGHPYGEGEADRMPGIRPPRVH